MILSSKEQEEQNHQLLTISAGIWSEQQYILLNEIIDFRHTRIEISLTVLPMTRHCHLSCSFILFLMHTRVCIYTCILFRSGLFFSFIFLFRLNHRHSVVFILQSFLVITHFFKVGNDKKQHPSILLVLSEIFLLLKILFRIYTSGIRLLSRRGKNDLSDLISKGIQSRWRCYSSPFFLCDSQFVSSMIKTLTNMYSLM